MKITQLKSRLSATKYPCLPLAEALKYLELAPGILTDNTDPVLIGRMGALVKDLGKGNKALITSTWRDTQKQAKIFLSKGGKYSAKLGYYWPDSVPNNLRLVAKPGRSFHEFGLALDCMSEWFKAIDSVSATSMQKTLVKYGLFKPMTKGNGLSVLESWHVQPIETNNVPLEKRAGMMPFAA